MGKNGKNTTQTILAIIIQEMELKSIPTQIQPKRKFQMNISS